MAFSLLPRSPLRLPCLCLIRALAVLGIVAAVHPSPTQAEVSGPRRAVVLFARFADESAADSLAPAWAAQLFDPDRRGSLAHYYDTMSFGVLNLRGEAAPRRYAMDHPADYYAPQGAPTAGNYREFALDVLRQADRDVDFSRFDADADGVVDALFIVLSKTPPNFINAGATGVGNLGLDTVYVTEDLGADGLPVQIDPERGTLQRGRSLTEAVGAMAHEYGHVLGLGDLYNVAYALSESALPPAADDAGIGAWGLMGWGATVWPDGDGVPAALSAWSRLRLGWARVHAPSPVDSLIRLTPVASTGAVVQLPLTPQESFVLEYRTREGDYDADIPSEGLLVWHVRRGVRDSAGSVSRTLVDLECADGLWAEAGYPAGATPDPRTGGDNLDFWAHDTSYRQAHAGNLGDATDPFDGVRFTEFTPETNPPATSHDGEVRVRLEDIHISAGAVTARVTPAPPLVALRGLRVVDEDGDGLFFVDEPLTLILSVVNEGGTILQDVRVRVVDADHRLRLDHQEASFGDLRPGSSTVSPVRGAYPEWRVLPARAEAEQVEVGVQVWSGSDLLYEAPVRFLAHGPNLPVVGARLVESAGNGDGMAQPGEIVVAAPHFAFTELSAVGNERQRALRQLTVEVRPLDAGVRALSSSWPPQLLVSDSSLAGVHWPELLVGADAVPAVPGRLRIELGARSAYGIWRDTLSVPFTDGPDRTSPRVSRFQVVAGQGEVDLALPGTGLVEGSPVSSAVVEVQRMSDRTTVARLALASDGAGGLAGRWSPAPEGLWRLRAKVTDAAGNEGNSAWQVLSTLQHAVSSLGETSAWRALPPIRGTERVEPQALVLAPSQENVLYLVGDDGAWRSEDDGATWEQMVDLPAPQGLQVDAGDALVVYQDGEASRVSRDGGASWQMLTGVDSEVLNLRWVDRQAPGRLYAFGETSETPRLLVSEDGGQSWEQRSEVPSSHLHVPRGEHLYAGFRGSYNFSTWKYDPETGYHSADGGRTWEAIPQIHVFHHFEAGPSGRVYAATEDTLFLSDDHGQSWRVARVVGSGIGPFGFSVHATESQVVMWTQDAAWRSPDGGETWSEIAMTHGGRADVIYQSPADAGRLYGLSIRSSDGSALVVSRDVGQTWQPVSLPSISVRVGTVRFDSVGRLYAGTAVVDSATATAKPAIAVLDPGDVVWRWRDGEIDGGVQVGWFGAILEMEDLLFDPNSPQRMFALLSGHLLRSPDGGHTWEASAYTDESGRRRVTSARQLFLAGNHPLLPLIADPLREGTLYLGANGSYVSADGGRTWTQRFSTSYRDDSAFYPNVFRGFVVDPENPETMYAAIDASLWLSVDAGWTWQQDYAALPGVPSMLRQAPGATLRIYLAAGGVLQRSDDGGLTWERLADLRDTGFRASRIRFVAGDSSRFYLVGCQ